MHAAIRAIEYYLPQDTLSNEQLARQFPNWSAEKVRDKTGIESRHVTGKDEYASDLAVQAAQRLLARNIIAPHDVDFLLLCTQSPDYLLPTTACLVQQRLQLPTTTAALDVNLGCSGYVYGLSLAKSLIEAGEARNVLLLTCESYTKHMDPEAFSVRAIFGDAATATLVQSQDSSPEGTPGWMGPFVYGTDGSGKESFILHRGGTRQLTGNAALPPAIANRADLKDPRSLYMDGPAIFSFTLKAVPQSVQQLLDKAELPLDRINWFVFHQANAFMLEHLRNKIRIPQEKFLCDMADCGNTTSSSIPIVLRRMAERGRFRKEDLLMLVGFGVGFSWAAAMVRWFDA